MSDNSEGELTPTQKASQVKRTYQAELMAKANVVGVGVGFRHVEGQRTETVALVVLVAHKLPDEQLAPEDILPKEIEGVPVDVQEIGEIKAF